MTKGRDFSQPFRVFTGHPPTCLLFRRWIARVVYRPPVCLIRIFWLRFQPPDRFAVCPLSAVYRPVTHAWIAGRRRYASASLLSLVLYGSGYDLARANRLEDSRSVRGCRCGGLLTFGLTASNLNPYSAAPGAAPWSSPRALVVAAPGAAPWSSPRAPWSSPRREPRPGRRRAGSRAGRRFIFINHLSLHLAVPLVLLGRDALRVPFWHTPGKRKAGGLGRPASRLAQ